MAALSPTGLTFPSEDFAVPAPDLRSVTLSDAGSACTEPLAVSRLHGADPVELQLPPRQIPGSKPSP